MVYPIYPNDVIKQYDGASICNIIYYPETNQYHACIVSRKKSPYEDEQLLVSGPLEYCVERMKTIVKLKVERNIV